MFVETELRAPRAPGRLCSPRTRTFYVFVEDDFSSSRQIGTEQ